jgi:hypothetical protein
MASPSEQARRKRQAVRADENRRSFRPYTKLRLNKEEKESFQQIYGFKPDPEQHMDAITQFAAKLRQSGQDDSMLGTTAGVPGGHAGRGTY